LNLGDLVEHWTVVGAEQDLVAAKHSDTRLGFALAHPVRSAPLNVRGIESAASVGTANAIMETVTNGSLYPSGSGSASPDRNEVSGTGTVTQRYRPHRR
jgi:hypothetical protein